MARTALFRSSQEACGDSEGAAELHNSGVTISCALQKSGIHVRVAKNVVEIKPLDSLLAFCHLPQIANCTWTCPKRYSFVTYEKDGLDLKKLETLLFLKKYIYI